MDRMKIDVVINVYARPYQTMLSLMSLMRYCEDYIDKIYYIEEYDKKKTDYITTKENEIVQFFFKKYHDRIIYYTPKYWNWVNSIDYKSLQYKEFRQSIRYQYAFENCEKDYLLILHNDIEFFSNPLPELLTDIDHYGGSGSIGQCWNCPYFWQKQCNSTQYFDFRPDYSQSFELYSEIQPPPGKIKRLYFLREHEEYFKLFPWPLPECRLNEYTCLINLKKTKKLTYPIGDGTLFGMYDTTGSNGSQLDIGCGWFRDMSHAGLKFKHINLKSYLSHNSGHKAYFDQSKYVKLEQDAYIKLQYEYL